MSAVRRQRATALAAAVAALAAGIAGAASAAATYPDGLDATSLAQWLVQETDLKPAQVIAIGRTSLAAIVAGPEARDGVTRVTVRLEATTPPAPLPNDVEILSSQVDVAVDCERRLVRQSASTGHPGRNLAGTGYIISDQDSGWIFPTVGTQLDAVWRAACDPAFVRPLVPPAPPPLAQAPSRSRRTQLAQAARPKPRGVAPTSAPPTQTKGAPPPPAAAPEAAERIEAEAAAAPPRAEPPAPAQTAKASDAEASPIASVKAAETERPAAAASEPAAEPPPPSAPAAAASATPTPTPASDATQPPASPPARARPAHAATTAAAKLDFSLRVRLGPFSDEGAAAEALQRLLGRKLSILNGRAAFVGRAQGGDGFAIELAGFEDPQAAVAACSVLAITEGACALAPRAPAAGPPPRRRPAPHAAKPSPASRPPSASVERR